MTKRRWPKLLAVLAGLALAAAACGDDSEGGTSATTQPTNGTETTTDPGGQSLEGMELTVYSGRNESLVQPLIDDFQAATGVKVNVRYGNSAEMAAALLEEGSRRTPADVFYSQEAGAVGVLAKAGLLSPLPDDVVQEVHEKYRPEGDNLWVGVTGRSRVIVYNPDKVSDPPTSVLDLTDPQYKGQVAWAPSNASFQTFVTAFRVSKGEDAAREWLEAMKANDAQAYDNNTAILEAVDNGDIGLGLINHYYWARMLPEVGGAENMTAQLVFPTGDDPGALVMVTAAAITTRGAENPAAVAFVEYLLSVEGQTYFRTETFEYPLIAGVGDPEGIPPLAELEGPALDQTDLDSLEESQQLLTQLGLLS